MGMVIVTGSTGKAHVTSIDDAIRNGNVGHVDDNCVFDVYEKFNAVIRTANLVRVKSGYGMLKGRYFKIEENDYEDLIIDNGEQGKKRCDIISARYSMSQQTGNEKIELVVLQGDFGSDYVRPSTIDGTPNTLDTEAKTTDFPLYEVHVNGLTLESITPLFTVLPDGGRVGTLENTLDTHLTTNDPHRIAFNTDAIPTNQFSNDNFLVSGESLKSIFEKLACTIRRVLSHVSDMGNPHRVGGDQLSRVVPISKGGTGATTAAQALENLGVPSTVAQSATKTYVDNKISELQTSFQDGVESIRSAFTDVGYTLPSNPTPNDVATGVRNIGDRTITFSKQVTLHAYGKNTVSKVALDPTADSYQLVGLYYASGDCVYAGANISKVQNSDRYQVNGGMTVRVNGYIDPTVATEIAIQTGNNEHSMAEFEVTYTINTNLAT